MNIKKALPFAVAAYIIPFFIIVILGAVMGENLVQPTPVLGIIGLIVTIALLVFFALKYFKTTTPSAKEGFLFGILVAIVGMIIDTIFFATITGRTLGNLANPGFWGAFAVVIIIPVIVGFVKGRK